MPSYPIAFPSKPIPAEVKVRRRSVVARFDNTYTLQQQVQLFPATRWEIEVTLQRMTSADAEEWTRFMTDLQGGYGTFSFNLTPYCPGMSPAPGVKTFRLAANDPGWTTQFGMTYDFTFAAIEAL